MLDAFVRPAEPQQVLAEQGLRVGIARGELDEALEQVRGLLSVAELLRDLGQKIERGRVFRLQPRGRLELGASLLAPVQVVESASLVVVRDGRIRVKPHSLGELFERALEIVAVGQRNAEIQVGAGRIRLGELAWRCLSAWRRHDMDARHI